MEKGNLPATHYALPAYEQSSFGGDVLYSW
jgi:hypothetical protein